MSLMNVDMDTFRSIAGVDQQLPSSQYPKTLTAYRARRAVLSELQFQGGAETLSIVNSVGALVEASEGPAGRSLTVTVARAGGDVYIVLPRLDGGAGDSVQ